MERGLKVAGVKPLRSSLFLAAFRLRYGRAEALGISAIAILVGEQCHPQGRLQGAGQAQGQTKKCLHQANGTQYAVRP